MQGLSWQRIRSRVRALRRPGLTEVAFVLVGLACLLLPQWWALSRNKSQRRQEVWAALRTTADTTKDAIDAWAAERVRRAQDVVGSARFAEILSEALADTDRAAVSREELKRRVHRAGFAEYAILDADGSSILGAGPDQPGRVAAVQGVPPTGGFVPWDSTPKWRPAVVVPLEESFRPGAYLALPLDAQSALAQIVNERALGRTGRTSVYVESGGWVADSGGLGPPSCRDDPSKVLAAAGETASGGVAEGPFNLDGYPNCYGDEVVGVWRAETSVGAGLLTELSLGEAYSSLAASRLTFIAFGLVAGCLLLVLVLLQTSGESLPESPPARPLRSNAAWGILGVALLATVIAWLSARSRYVQFQRDRFATAAERVEGELVHRLEHQATALRAVRAAMNAFPDMSQRQSDQFLSSLDLSKDFAAISCIAVVDIDDQDEGRRPSSVCLDDSDALGANACAACADLRSFPALLDAARAANQMGRAAVSLLPDAVVGGGSYLAMAPPRSEKNSLGPVPVVVVNVEDITRDLTRNQAFAVDLELYGAAAPTAAALLFRTTPSVAPADVTDEIAPLRRIFDFGGRPFTLLISPAESISAPITQNYPAQVLLAGLAISVLLFDIALVLSSTRARAMAIAELMTRRFRDGEVRIRAVLDSAPDGIVSFNPSGVISMFNPGAEKLFGYNRDEIANKRIQDLLPHLEIEEGRVFQQLDRKALRKGGREFPAEVTLSRMEIDGRLSYIAIVRDVSARREAQERLTESEERYALAARGANDGLWDWNLKTNSIYYSARWRSMIGIEGDEFGSSPEEWLGRIHSEDVAALRRRLADHLDGREPHFECEYRIQHANGGYRWMLTRGIAVRDEEAKATRIAGSQTDITDRKRAERQLLYDALHDPLTGLPNRTYFMGRVDQARINAARSSNRMFGLLFLDIDRFKVVNDSLGHYVGDQLLVAVSERLKNCLRPGDTICRLGGDEFAILVEQIDGVGNATGIAERIQHDLERPLRVGEREIFAAVSIGIALSSTGKQTADELLRDADLAMYRAKSRGKARYELFSQRLHTRAVELLQLETDLRHAVERDELVLHYQPIVDLASGEISSCEALIRWNHPQKGLMPPGEFIAVAEESGAIIQITRWVLEAACRQRQAWIDAGLPAVRVSVNISPRQLLQQDIYNLVAETLSAYEQPPEALQIELTESALMESSESTVAPLKELYERGVRISLDDFGTGYSSLIYLRRFPIHNIKIDQSFVRSIPHDEGNAAIASGLIALAHSLNLYVVAEGVETIEQLRFLRDKGCDEIQGYVVSPAVPAAEFAEILLSRIDVLADEPSLVIQTPETS